MDTCKGVITSFRDYPQKDNLFLFDPQKDNIFLFDPQKNNINIEI